MSCKNKYNNLQVAKTLMLSGTSVSHIFMSILSSLLFYEKLLKETKNLRGEFCLIHSFLDIYNVFIAKCQPS